MDRARHFLGQQRIDRRWRATRLSPVKAAETISTWKCVSPSGRAPAWPAWRWESSRMTRRVGGSAGGELGADAFGDTHVG